jgi:transposase-like protein
VHRAATHRNSQRIPRIIRDGRKWHRAKVPFHCHSKKKQRIVQARIARKRTIDWLSFIIVIMSTLRNIGVDTHNDSEVHNNETIGDTREDAINNDDTTTPTTTPTPTKKRLIRARYTNAAKLAIAKRVVLTGNSISSVAREEGLPEATVRGWVKRIDELETHPTGTGHEKAIHPDRTPTLTVGLKEYCQRLRDVDAAAPITIHAIAEKARDLATKLLEEYERDPSILTESEATVLRSRTFSQTWSHQWLRKHVLIPPPLQGDAAELDTHTRRVMDDLVAFQTTLKRYTPEFIYHVEEVLVYYRLLPRSEYMTRDTTDATQLVGATSLTALDRVTLYVATNATGTHKLPLCIVRSERHPACFGRNPHKQQQQQQQSGGVVWLVHPHALSNVGTVTDWWNQVFVRHVRAVTDRRVLLLMTPSCGHDATWNDALHQIQVLMVPTSVAAVYAPMRSIARTLVSEYRYKLLNQVLEHVQHLDELNCIAQSIRVEKRGLEEGKHVNLWNLQTMLLDVWDTTMDVATIAQAWTQSKLFAPRPRVDVRVLREAEKEREENTQVSQKTSDMIVGIVYALNQLRLPLDESQDDALLTNVRALLELKRKVTRKQLALEIDKWLLIETTPDFVEWNNHTRERVFITSLGAVTDVVEEDPTLSDEEAEQEMKHVLDLDATQTCMQLVHTQQLLEQHGASDAAACMEHARILLLEARWKAQQKVAAQIRYL